MLHGMLAKERMKNVGIHELISRALYLVYLNKVIMNI